MEKEQFDFYYSVTAEDKKRILEKDIGKPSKINFIEGKRYNLMTSVGTPPIFDDAVFIYTATLDTFEQKVLDREEVSEPKNHRLDFRAPGINSTWLKLFSDREDESKGL